MNKHRHLHKRQKAKATFEKTLMILEKKICNFYLKHQLVAKHLNPFNIAFQNFLMEVRCPFLDRDIYRLMQVLPEEEFEDKKIIKDLAYHLYDFDSSNYKKYGLPQLFSKKIAFKRKYVNA